MPHHLNVLPYKHGMRIGKKIVIGLAALVFVIESLSILVPICISKYKDALEDVGQQPSDSKRYESVGNNNGRIIFPRHNEFLLKYGDTFEEVFKPLLLSEKVRGFLPVNIHISGDGNVLSSLGCISGDPEFDKSILRKIDSIKLDPLPGGKECRFSIFLVSNESQMGFE